MLGLKLLFHSVAIRQGFGFAAILAWTNKDSLGALEGASLTGKLSRPVRLAIDLKEYSKQDSADSQYGLATGSVQRTGRIEYNVGGHDRGGTLRKNHIYV